jgi:putative transposase
MAAPWQRRRAQKANDTLIRDEQHFERASAYIEANPVKRGLVRRPEDWPWSSA